MEKLKTAKRLFFIWFVIEDLLVFSFLGSAFYSVAQANTTRENPWISFLILVIESVWSVLMLISIKFISETAHEKKIFNYYLASFITLLIEKIIQFLFEKTIVLNNLPVGYEIVFALLVFISFYFMKRSFELISYKFQEPSFRLAGIGIMVASILFTIGYFLATNSFKTNTSTSSIWIAIFLCFLGFVIGTLVFVSLIEGFSNLGRDIDIQSACK